jgi:hypothetical protein
MEFDMAYTTGKFTVDEIGFIQIAQSRVLAAVAHGELDLNLIAREELSIRGQDENSSWVGFYKAQEMFLKAKQERLFQSTENMNIKLTQAEYERDKAISELEQVQHERARMLSMLRDLLSYAPGCYADDPRSDSQIDADKELAFDSVARFLRAHQMSD